MTIPLYRCPRRFIFIASIGNPAPYTGTRHSAGHVLLDALQGPLHERIGLVSETAGKIESAAATATDTGRGSLFYSTWKSPAFMNVSGPPVLRQFRNWMGSRQAVFNALAPTLLSSSSSSSSSLSGEGSRGEGGEEHRTKRLLKGSALTPIDVDTRDLTRFRPTLVILHDELEAAPGKVKVRRGGPEQASLRGHRGLISVIDSLRGARLLTSPSSSGKKDGPAVSVVRVGIGIGRPVSRERDAVSDYVLGRLSASEVEAVHRAVPEVVEVLVKEMYREGDD